MRSRIFLKLLAYAFFLVVIATIIIDFSIRQTWESSLRSEIQQSLTQKAALFADELQDVNNPQLQQLVARVSKSADARVTVITTSGKVLADSEADAETMENHATRPEFQRALKNSTGSDSRTSHTLGIEFLYVAAPVKNGAVRLAYPLSAIRNAVAEGRNKLMQGSAIALLLSTLLAAIAAQSISRRLQKIMGFAGRIAQGDFAARIDDPSSDEISQVAVALDKTARHLQETFTALEYSRQELETLLNSMQEAVIAVSPVQKVRWLNGSMARLLPGGSHIGKSVVHVIRDPGLLQILTDSMKNHAVLTTRVATLAPGQILQATTAPLPDGGAVAVLHDLTEVERVEKTRRDFIANVSHELRTPLTSIQGYTETLLDTSAGVNGNAHEFLEIIKKNAARMSRLTEDLLTLARVESGERKLELHPISVDSLLQDALRNFRQTAQENGNGVQLEIEASLSATVIVDADAIHQVFSNLIDNAIKYAGAGKRILLGARTCGVGPKDSSSRDAQISSRNVDVCDSDIGRKTGSGSIDGPDIHSENCVEFYVRDFGPGIALEHQPRIFERFYRVDKARSKETGGTGLGLAIVKHIVLNHGGAVRVESALRHGATFFFSLPLVSVETPKLSRE